VGEGAKITMSQLHDSLLGDHVDVRGVKGRLSVADHAEVVGEG
jgi:hypothetical protein